MNQFLSRRLLILLGILYFVTVITNAQSDRVILFTSRPDADWQLYTVDPAGGEPELFLDLSGYGMSDAKLSPDGSKLAFIGFEAQELLKILYVLDMQSGEVTHIRTDRAEIDELNWSADSERLIYLAEGVIGNFTDVFQYDTVTGTEQKLDWRAALFEAQPFTIIRGMEQSPDGEKFIFSILVFNPEWEGYEMHFILFNVEDKTAKRLRLTRDSHSPFAWNESSDVIYFLCSPPEDTEANEICSIDLETEQTKIAISGELVPEMDMYGIHELSFDQHQLGISFLINSQIYLFDLQSQAITRILPDVDEEIKMLGWIDMPNSQLIGDVIQN
jgi:dipeptidyl aminopeptidase/acylaminoacyl peptidase